MHAYTSNPDPHTAISFAVTCKTISPSPYPPFSDHEIYKNAYRQSQHRNSQSYIASVIPPPVTHLRPPVPSGGLSFFHGLFCQSPSASFVHGYKSLPCSSFLVDLRKLSGYYDFVKNPIASEKDYAVHPLAAYYHTTVIIASTKSQPS